MNTADPYVTSRRRVRRLPVSVRATRVLLLAGAALTVVLSAASLADLGMTSENLGRVMFSAWPGVLALVAALRLADGRHAWLVRVRIASIFWVLLGVSGFGAANPFLLPYVVPGIAVLIAVTRPESRAFLSGR